MKKIYILLASLFLLTGCDAILDAAYPDNAPDYDNTDKYEFTVDGLPYDLNRWNDYDKYYFPVVIPNGDDVTISSIEFKVYDYYYSPVGYWEGWNINYDYVYTYNWGYVPMAWENDSPYSAQYNDYVDYFEFSPNEFEYGLRDNYWDYNYNLYVKIRVIYFDGTEREQEHIINLY